MPLPLLRMVTCPPFPACAAGTLICHGAANASSGPKCLLAHARAVHQHFHVGRVGQFAAQRQVIGQSLDHHRRLLGRVPVVAIAMFGEPARRFRHQPARAILHQQQLEREGRRLRRGIVPEIEQAVVRALPVRIDVSCVRLLLEQICSLLCATIICRSQRQPGQRQSLVAQLVADCPTPCRAHPSARRAGCGQRIDRVRPQVGNHVGMRVAAC